MEDNKYRWEEAKKKANRARDLDPLDRFFLAMEIEDLYYQKKEKEEEDV